MACNSNILGNTFFSFVGPFNLPGYAKDRMITIVFPRGLKEGNTVLTYWQWDADAKGNKNKDCNLKGVIEVIGKDVNSPYIRFYKGEHYYWFDGNMNVMGNSIEMNLVMHDPKETCLDNFKAKLHHTK